MKVSFLFPGQGAQKVGMGKEFYENSPEAKRVFEQADEIIPGLSEVVLNGPVEQLTQTKFCQPGILTFSIAALKAFEAHPKFKNITPVFAAGLSLGEYSALAASGALSLQDTVRLVERRGSFMDEACQARAGKMAAIIGVEKERVLGICQETGAEVANFNSPQQIVITGQADKVDAASAELKKIAKMVIPLEVSGAFHSSLMKSAEEKFKHVLANVPIRQPAFQIIHNMDGRPAKDTEEIRVKLTTQITSSVRWVETIQYMVSKGVSSFIEIGPGKVLSGLVKRIDRGLTVFNIEVPEDIEKLF
jgi:[acyl-carrier-protein] S-malonyltransferase